jgi:hypothetical protein
MLLETLVLVVVHVDFRIGRSEIFPALPPITNFPTSNPVIQPHCPHTTLLLTTQPIDSNQGHRCHSKSLLLPHKNPPITPRSIYPLTTPPTSSHPMLVLETTPTMSQTMLLTKPLSTFLSTNTTPQLPTLLLLSPTGKLLSSSSPSPASTLRTQATLACSLWTLYHPFQSSVSLVSASLPTSPNNQHQNLADADLNALTIQLEFGVMCIRALTSGLLFVAIGPDPSSAQSPYPSSQYLQHLTSVSSSPNAQLDREREGGSQLKLEDVGSGGSEAGSIGTERSVGASIWGVRRQAEDVGRFLEGALQGFVLSSVER